MSDGPNVRRLVMMKMAREAVPAKGGMMDALRFLTDREAITASARAATTWVRDAIDVVRQAAEPNPFRDADDEAIASEILQQIEAKKEKTHA